jgi:hypothetical protein
MLSHLNIALRLHLSDGCTMELANVMRRGPGIIVSWMFTMAVTLTACTSTKSGPSATSTDAAVPENTTDSSTDASDQKDTEPQVCPGTTVASCPPTIPSYSIVVTSIVQSRCGGCHSQTNDAGLWPLNDQPSLSDWQVTILQVMRACTQPPPGSGVSLTLSERKAFEAWLVCGAPDN